MIDKKEKKLLKKHKKHHSAKHMAQMKKDMKTHVCDWVNLQKSVYESAHAGETLGISLKKTGKTAKFSEFNTPEEKQEIK